MTRNSPGKMYEKQPWSFNCLHSGVDGGTDIDTFPSERRPRWYDMNNADAALEVINLNNDVSNTPFPPCACNISPFGMKAGSKPMLNNNATASTS